jgi:FkbM family methyltransferase
VNILKRFCNSKKVSLDIGANKGVFTLYLSKLSRYVYSFEPLPQLSNYLSTVYQGCNVAIINCALGSEKGELYLNIPSVGLKQYDAYSSLVTEFEDKRILGDKVTNVDKIKVKLERLDDFELKDVGFIKIDVEGYEREVLEGATDTIRSNMPVMFIEIEQRHHRETSIYDVFKHITDLGCYGYFVENRKIRNIREFDADLYQDQRNEGRKDLYINDFVFSFEPIVRDTI